MPVLNRDIGRVERASRTFAGEYDTNLLRLLNKTERRGDSHVRRSPSWLRGVCAATRGGPDRLKGQAQQTDQVAPANPRGLEVVNDCAIAVFRQKGRWMQSFIWSHERLDPLAAIIRSAQICSDRTHRRESVRTLICGFHIDDSQALELTTFDLRSEKQSSYPQAQPTAGGWLNSRRK